jgi:hypothetical protein
MDLYIEGRKVEAGAKLADFRGDTLYFAGIAQEPSPGKSGKCYFATSKAKLKKGEPAWSVYYPGVVDGEIR